MCSQNRIPLFKRVVVDGPRSRRSRWVLWVIALLSLSAIYGGTLWDHMQRAADPLIFNDDARQQIPPFFRYAESQIGSRDYLGDYYLACFPLGYRLVYATAAGFWDPVSRSKVVPYLLLAGTLAGLALAASHFGGIPGAWAAMAICLGSALFLDRMTGGLPRAFALPLLAGGLAVLSRGRVRIVAGFVCLAAALYPVAAVCLGIALSLVLLVLPARDRGQAVDWPFGRRLRLLVVTALIAGSLILPVALSSMYYGPLITPADAEMYPEAGPGGRYPAKILPPYPGFAESALGVFDSVVLGSGRPWLRWANDWVGENVGRGKLIFVLLAVVCIGWIRLAASDAGARRVLTLAVAAMTGYWIARAFVPYLYVPHRYVLYPVAVITTVAVPASFAGFVRWREKPRASGWAGAAAVGAGCLILLLLTGGRGSPSAGFRVHIDDSSQIYSKLATLPRDSLIASWPRGLADNIPYVSRRPVLVSFESHQAFHARYVEELRRRMHALIAAYFATSPEPLIRLREEHGVTHLVVDLEALRGGKLRYFKPFKGEISRASSEAQGKMLEIERQMGVATIFREGSVVVLDLDRLDVRSDGGTMPNDSNSSDRSHP
jgi:hypothetical protein